jgi:hypothetical protein
MTADIPFHLSRGVAGPVQQSSITCGSAALTVARMLATPEFARWIIAGQEPKGGPPDSRSERDRFAEHEREAMNRTNGFRGDTGAGGRWTVPWPHALGTPPWGAARELEDVAARSGAAYAMRFVRLGSTGALRDAYEELVAQVREGLPALLYVGNLWSPRHVTLVLPSGGGAQGVGRPGDGRLDVYDPATGTVTKLAPELFASRTLAIAGWNVPWITVHPRHN